MKKLLYAQFFAAIAITAAHAQAVQPPAAAQPPAVKDTKPMTILVEDVRGEVQFQRENKWQSVAKDSKLTQGDRVLVNIGAILKLEFRHPVSEAVLAATILRGHTDMLVAEAYTQDEQSRTQLDVNQGLLRAGVVKTAVPPSFQVRTPRQVVGVRGTEIAEIEATPMGDYLRMGRLGIVMVHDVVPHYRSARAGQSTEKRNEGNRRDDTLMRAIEHALLDARVLLTGSHRRQLETDFDQQSFDMVEFNGGEVWKKEGNARYESWLNRQGSFGSGHGCPHCPPNGLSGHSK
jgi:hypothetical protein